MGRSGWAGGTFGVQSGLSTSFGQDQNGGSWGRGWGAREGTAHTFLPLVPSPGCGDTTDTSSGSANPPLSSCTRALPQGPQLKTS